MRSQTLENFTPLDLSKLNDERVVQVASFTGATIAVQAQPGGGFGSPAGTITVEVGVADQWEAVPAGAITFTADGISENISVKPYEQIRAYVSATGTSPSTVRVWVYLFDETTP